MRKRPKKVVVYKKYGHFFMVYEIFSVIKTLLQVNRPDIIKTLLQINRPALHAGLL
jgi:hypothetical protein